MIEVPEVEGVGERIVVADESGRGRGGGDGKDRL